jgi:hypothetical protein
LPAEQKKIINNATMEIEYFKLFMNVNGFDNYKIESLNRFTVMDKISTNRKKNFNIIQKNQQVESFSTCWFFYVKMINA